MQTTYFSDDVRRRNVSSDMSAQMPSTAVHRRTNSTPGEGGCRDPGSSVPRLGHPAPQIVLIRPQVRRLRVGGRPLAPRAPTRTTRNARIRRTQETSVTATPSTSAGELSRTRFSSSITGRRFLVSRETTSTASSCDMSAMLSPTLNNGAESTRTTSARCLRVFEEIDDRIRGDELTRVRRHDARPDVVQRALGTRELGALRADAPAGAAPFMTTCIAPVRSARLSTTSVMPGSFAVANSLPRPGRAQVEVDGDDALAGLREGNCEIRETSWSCLRPPLHLPP